MTIKDYLDNLKNSPRPETDVDRKKSAEALVDIISQQISSPIDYKLIPEIKNWLIDVCRMDKKETLYAIDDYHLSTLPTIIEMYDIVSIPSQKKYAFRSGDGVVGEHDFYGLCSKFPHEVRRNDKSEIDKMLKNSNRQKERIVYRIPTSQRPILPDEYNALCLKFLQPKLGPDPWFIDLVIKTLTGGEPGGAESMVKTILRKYRHPADRQIPWFIFSDQGGTGKGVLFEKVLTKIFGENVSNHNLSFDRMSSRFGDLRGKLCVLVNEAPSHKTDMDLLKSIVWESQHISEKKYQDEMKIDLYIWGGITSNPRNGRSTITPTGYDEDRRWSFFSVDPDCGTLLKAIQRKLRLEDLDQARIWLSENIEEHTNENNVASWLHQKLKQYVDTPEIAFHGKYYDTLLNNNRDLVDLICEIVFNDPNFIYITEVDLFGLYQQFCELNGANYRKTRPNLINEVKKKMRNHDVDHVRCNLGSEKSRLNCFKKGIKSTFPSHSQIYQRMLGDLNLFQDFLTSRGY